MRKLISMYFLLTIAVFMSLAVVSRAAIPVIAVQPQSQTVAPGAVAVFSIGATGTLPLRYGWRRNGNGIPDATNSTLMISNVQLADVGNYSVRVSDTEGFVFSAAAELAVLHSYTLNLPAGFSMIANQLENSNNRLDTIIPIAPDGTLLLKFNPVVQTFEGANTYVQGIGWLDDDFNPSATTLNPGEGAFINLPSAAALAFSGAFRPPRLPLSLVPGYNIVSRQNPLPANYEDIVGLPPTNGVVADQFDARAQDYRTHIFFQGRWRDGVPDVRVGEAIWVSQILFPTIVQQPVGFTNVAPGTNVTFTVVAAGSQPLHYQWRRNGVNIPDATNDTYTIANAQIFDAGTYTVAVQPGRFAPPTGSQSAKEQLAPGAVVSVPVALKFNTVNFPFSDSFSGRQGTNPLAGTVTGNNSAADVEPGEPRHAGKPGGHSVWMRWTALANGIVTFHSLGSAFDTLLAAYSGTNIIGAELDSDDDGEAFLASRIRFNAVSGQSYNIVLDGFAGASGNFVLNWNLEPGPDRVPVILTQPRSQVADIGGPAAFNVIASGTSFTYQWFHDGAAIQGATNAGYAISAVQEKDAGAYTVRLFNGQRTTFSRVAELQLRLDTVTPLLPSSPKGAGGTDPLALDKFQDVVAAATNDNVLALLQRPKSVAHGFSGTQIFSTVGAAKEPGEPSHAGVAGGKSKWYSYQPTNSGSLKINTDGSNFDTVLAVYIGPGDSFTTLTNVASDNNSGTNGKTSAVLFNVTSNAIYYIAVDGVNNIQTGVAASGNVHLNYRLALPLTLTSLGYFSSIDNGRVIFKVIGTPNMAATVQSATNLSPPAWTSLFTNTTANGIFNYTNTNAVTFSNRFYRAINQL